MCDVWCVWVMMWGSRQIVNYETDRKTDLRQPAPLMLVLVPQVSRIQPTCMRPVCSAVLEQADWKQSTHLAAVQHANFAKFNNQERMAFLVQCGKTRQLTLIAATVFSKAPGSAHRQAARALAEACCLNNLQDKIKYWLWCLLAYNCKCAKTFKAAAPFWQQIFKLSCWQLILQTPRMRSYRMLTQLGTMM